MIPGVDIGDQVVWTLADESVYADDEVGASWDPRDQIDDFDMLNGDVLLIIEDLTSEYDADYEMAIARHLRTGQRVVVYDDEVGKLV